MIYLFRPSVMLGRTTNSTIGETAEITRPSQQSLLRSTVCESAAQYTRPHPPHILPITQLSSGRTRNHSAIYPMKGTPAGHETRPNLPHINVKPKMSYFLRCVFAFLLKITFNYGLSNKKFVKLLRFTRTFV